MYLYNLLSRVLSWINSHILLLRCYFMTNGELLRLIYNGDLKSHTFNNLPFKCSQLYVLPAVAERQNFIGNRMWFSCHITWYNRSVSLDFCSHLEYDPRAQNMLVFAFLDSRYPRKFIASQRSYCVTCKDVEEQYYKITI